MKTSIKANERSEGGELITQMNLLFQENDWRFKSAIGELSVSTRGSMDDRNTTLYPDAIVFSDEAKLLPIMGWEFKMPDVSIDNDEYYANARDKADRLGTNVFVLWNFQYCKVYYRLPDKTWSKIPAREYDEYSSILINRKSVHDNFNVWHKQLEKVMSDLNSDMINDLYNVAPIQFNISNYVSTISDLLTPITSEYLLGLGDFQLMARIREWVRNENAEFSDIKNNMVNNKEASLLFSKNLIIRWVNRIIFCNLARKNKNVFSDILNDFNMTENIEAFQVSLNMTVKITDFYTILYVDKDEINIPNSVTSSLAEFSRYLWNINLSQTDENFVSKVLESIVKETKRQLMGLYTTPPRLAQLLVNLTMINTNGNYADFTVGSGTIVKAMIDKLREFNSIEKIHNQIWASDKYSYPLQIANFNMTSSDSFNLKNIVFQHNALNLKVNETVKIVNPQTGKNESLRLPQMDAIISNLPFVSSNNKSKEDKELLSKILKEYHMNAKTDLYQGLILYFKGLIKNCSSSRIGVIVSNSWFKNLKSSSFFEILIKEFDVKEIIYSDVSRWFNNASVVACILILSPKSDCSEKSKFISLETDIRVSSYDDIEKLSDQIMAGTNSKLFRMYEYSTDNIKKMIHSGICMEALFDNLDWYGKILDSNILCSINNIGKIQRGTRTGGDSIFITDGIKTDKTDSSPYVKSIKEITSLYAKPSGLYFFYTKDSIESLKNKKHLVT
ncbi:N-6 DNA methylase [Companilactobacillus kimchii]|nr:N-6 DNA methylase [Companilactobacillus kimchii]